MNRRSLPLPSFLATTICLLAVFAPAQSKSHQQGIVIKMRMADCIGPQHSFMAALSGAGREQPGELCPEYVLLADKVVYTIVGKSSNELLPLAEVTRFRFQNNEMLIRIDDAKHESHFQIREMILREEWERYRQHEEEELQSHHFDTTTAIESHP